MDYDQNLNDNLENDNQDNNENDNMSNEYGDINFVMSKPIIKPKKRRKKSIMGYIALTLVAAIIGGLSGSYITAYKFNDLAQEEAAKSAINAQEVNINLTDDVYFAAAVAEKSQKTVVGITTETERQVNTFWGPQMRTEQSMGSGFIVNTKGYILTNSHVIGDGQYKNITVSLIDGTKEIGQVLWYDTTLDLAVVKINKTGLPVAELGDSDELMVGEPAVAIGNPMTLDLERTVTQGIISGLNRSIVFDNGTVIEPLIQTDASINSGNSGGPLFNAEGQVIGINTAKMMTAEGLGFAIPINTAKPIVEQIINEGSFSSVYVGISGIAVETYERGYNIDLIADYGVVIIETVSNSPASEAGLQPNDVITAIDGHKIEDMEGLKRRLYNYKDGDKSEFTILRNGNELILTVNLKNKPGDF
ncbi:MAG: trypsin-like peptidase domain-containing protein [Tissierellia bacterium]|jgi:S1-C subfamily serine protease|nr:trypsin-like peptidase domain-containing protein [Tissierellia bacterium]MDD3226002.1 trypsin-like peptidase domain-containing protein [Tissierellia bacterium]MDD3750495.1 trypsin-like peptidase domain-containing protein [Tissierellia bacterium]MDD4045964.1 trypsin-like peptidase domain-containing protein [Tissierellia bacterium]MDD4677840.1 trypsin-like peptidase domain-containing protein [Tissierellia bacterium]